jgi:hypothetical protein
VISRVYVFAEKLKQIYRRERLLALKAKTQKLKAKSYFTAELAEDAEKGASR